MLELDNRMNWVAIMLVLLLASKPGSAQTFTTDIRHISIEDGLSNRFIISVYEDSDGFVWIGTRNGLNQYDGYDFRLFALENSNIRSNEVNEIYEDKNKRLWLIQANTNNLDQSVVIDLLDLTTKKIKPFQEVFADVIPFDPSDVMYVRTNPNNELWISLKNGTIYKYDEKGFQLIFSIPDQTYIYFFQASEKHLWVYTHELWKLSLNGEVVERYQYQGDLANKEYGQNNMLWHDQDSSHTGFRIISNDDLLTLDSEELHLPLNVLDRGFKRFGVDPTNDLVWWYQKDTTLRDSQKDYFFAFHPENGDPMSLKEKVQPLFTYGYPQITNLHFGSKGRIWVATEDGLLVIKVKENHFKTVLAGKSSGYSTRGIVEDNDGKLYVNLVSHHTRMIIDLSTGTMKAQPGGTLFNANWLGASKDTEGNLWFSGQDRVIEKFDPTTSESQYYVHEMGGPNDLPWSQWTILNDSRGNVWTGTFRGVYRLDPKTGEYQKFDRTNDWPVFSSSASYHLLEHDGKMWAATSNGLFSFSLSEGVTARYGVKEELGHRIPYDHIMFIHIDQKGVFWLATKGGGMIRFDVESGDYRQFTMKDGLSNNVIYAIYEDGYGNIWMPSDNGLMQFDKNNFEVNSYFVGDGIAHNEFNTSSHFQSDDGQLYFGGLSGVTYFDPKDFVEEDSSSVPLRITRLQVLDGRTGKLLDKTTQVTATNELVLSPSNKSTILDFALLNFENTHQNIYAYRIDGLDEEWLQVRENSLRINALPYGTHTLRIKGRGGRGQWSSDELILRLIVLRPIYLRAWFLVLSFLFAITAIYGVFRWRLHRLKVAQENLQLMVEERTETVIQQKDQIEEQAEKLKNLDKTKSRFFANISHELRTPLTLILGHLGSILNKPNLKLSKDVRSGLITSKQNGQQLLRLTEEILDLSKLESGKLKVVSKPVAFYPFIKRLMDGYRSLINQKEISLSLKFDLPKDIVLNIDEGKFDKIINNLLSNAIKYTDSEGKINLSLSTTKPSARSQEPPNIELTLADTGRGIHPEDMPHIFNRFYQSEQANALTEGGTGIGLALAKELAYIMDGSLKAESDLNKGSTFTFTFPAHIVSSGTNTSEITFETEEEELEVDSLANSVLGTPISMNGKETVLLVEDHPEMRSYIKQILDPRYHIVEAVDGVQGLEKMQRQSIDLVVSDVMMPRLDGFGLLKEMRNTEALKDMPLMMLTARAASEDKLQAFDIGVDDYLTKPFEATELLARIQNLIRNKRQRIEATQGAEEEAEGDNLSSFDKDFVKRAEEIVQQEIDNSQFGIIDMAEALNVSQRNLARKMQLTTGLTPLQFIREVRLQAARQLLENRKKETVAEVMYAIGILSTGYFAKIYFKRFGKHPSSYF